VADFGYLQVYISLLTAMASIAALRYEYAVLIADDGEGAANVFAAALATVFLMSGGAALVVAALYHVGWADRLLSGFARWLWTLPLAVLAVGVMQVQTNWALRNKRFASVARAKIGQIGAQLALQVGGGLMGAGPFGLIVGDIGGRAFAGGGLTWGNLRHSPQRLRGISLRGMGRAARRYKEFPLVSSASGLVNTGGFALPPLLIGYFYGAVVLGHFALVDRVMAMPAVLVGQAISQIYMSEAGRLAASDPGALRHIFLRTLKGLLSVAAIPAVLIAVVAPWFFPLVLGPQWREAGVYAQLLLPRAVLTFAMWPLSMTLTLLEKQRLQLVWDVGRLVLTSGAIWVSYRLGASPRVALACFGLAMVVGYVAYGFLCNRVLRANSLVVSTRVRVEAIETEVGF
jgi:O-antigen/teichoic acid export membrane protein